MELVVIELSELKRIISEEIKTAVGESINTYINKHHFEESEAIIKRSDVAEMFGVSLVTIHDWMKRGVLPYHKMNGRSYFKKSEVINAMKDVKIRKKSSNQQPETGN